MTIGTFYEFINKEFLKMEFTPNPSSIFKNEKIKFTINTESLSHE
jgi:hypothetical protein